MILDSLLKVSAAQQVTADAVSGNTIDLGALTIQRQIATGEPLALVVCITAVGTNTGSARVEAIQSAAAALSAPVIIGELDLVTADLAAGKCFIIPLSYGEAPLRYLGANYDITGTVDFTVDSYVMPLSMAHGVMRHYAKGYTIS
jgi:hypothetical protein